MYVTRYRSCPRGDNLVVAGPSPLVKDPGLRMQPSVKKNILY